MKIILILLIILGLSGCETIKVAQETRYIDAVIESGEAEEVLTDIDLTSFQLMRLTSGLNAYNSFKGKWTKFTDKPVDVLEKNIPDLKNDLNNLHDHFVAIQADVTENWDKYTLEQQKLLLDYEIHVDRLAEGIKKHYRYEHYAEVLRMSLQYAKVATKVAIYAGSAL
ncbi:hypothetical protein [uncultured Paraglaciecola sp.]|uniref:hypothetical protein n=1 Tax=uncultured Paraglaciecola sp. TaxID=1765024 RepID=UPI0026322426|nr:hypothetical protein [uncultured Paraglaciecola sp.]